MLQLLLTALPPSMTSVTPGPPRVPRRAMLLFTTATAATATPASALNLELVVADIDAKATERTAGDFSAALEVRPISGPQGIVKAFVEVCAHLAQLANARTPTPSA